MILALADMTAWIIWAAVLVAAAAVSFMYSGLEIGIYVMNKIRLDLRAESGHKTARMIRKLVSNQRNFLAVLMIGNNLMNYAATFAISAMFWLAGYGDHSEWYAMAVATPLLFVFCESLPKSIAQRLSERLVYRLGHVLRVSSIMFNAVGLASVVRGFSSLLVSMLGLKKRGYVPMGREGLTAVVAEGHATGILTHMQTVMTDRVMHIAEVKLKDVMIPMHKVAWAGENLSRDEMLQLMRAHNFSRFPIRNEAGQITGIINIYAALADAEQSPATKAIREPLVLPDKSAVTDALYRMQRTHSPMAIVADKTGKHVGIVTIKDLVEEIVGELDAW